MHVTKRVYVDWLIDWVSELVSELLSEWVSEAEADREHIDALHHTTPWYLPNIINFICSVALNLRNKQTNVLVCPCVCLTIRDECFRVRPGPCPSRIHAFSDFTWSVVYNAKTEIRLAGSMLRERFATINLLISIERMVYGYQSNMVCNTNNSC